MSADPGSIPRPVNLNFIFNSLGFSVILFMNSFKCSHLIIFEFFSDCFQTELLFNLFNSFTQFQVKLHFAIGSVVLVRGPGFDSPSGQLGFI